MDRRLTPAAVAVAATLVLCACSTADDGTANSPSRSPSSSSSSSSSPSASPSAEPGEVLPLPADDGAGYVAVAAGRYTGRLSDSLRYEVDVPEGSQVFGGAFINTSGGGLHFVAAAPRRSTALPKHPCRDHSYTAVGPTVSDLAEALSRQAVLEVSTPSPGHGGRHDGVGPDSRGPRRRATPSTALTIGLSCTAAVPDLDATPGSQERATSGAGGSSTCTTAADVVHAECSTSCSADEVTRLDQMVESMTFETL